ncbi:MAG: YqgQ family protein [Lactobacillales bacterium]|nr:YqgQ family protein [Lactobacillales bacterium]
METYQDVLDMLKKFDIYVYIGNKLYDLELQAQEVKKLHEGLLIDQATYLKALMIIKREHRIVESTGGVAKQLLNGDLLKGDK